MEQFKTTLILFISCLVLLGFSSCGELSDSQTQRVKEALSDTLLSSTETWDVDMELIEKGQKKVRIRGSYAATYTMEEMNETRISGPVFVQVFDSTGTVETRVTANRAVYQPDESIFQLHGDVKVRTITNRRLRSEYLKWNSGDNRVSTPQFVIITTPSDSIAGNGFEGTTDLSEYTIREVTGQVTVD
ncbi:LPS export ABC transporter periplasmic protein LptC [Aliifodinibius sp. S!AR15-10]|uniref:LPS export ABC transporter periplasmic protein LptC n=1 Tax=Aliifodinibius sp. S!AR15-10 TaxID=2950437 RepID=UPI0028624E8A|nr:LPS export ABC transporter periplasmic protein LptC [Aliifodinibius sp. S!AR15-10]MDR8390409.1 LPS export ABC transporter periplasmic protein LptC [Aliifodinibius sp. S!AR15-10]